MSGSLHIWPGTHPVTSMFINANAGETTGVCRNGAEGRDVCSVLQAASLSNCDCVYKGTDKIKFSD